MPSPKKYQIIQKKIIWKMFEKKNSVICVQCVQYCYPLDSVEEYFPMVTDIPEIIRVKLVRWEVKLILDQCNDDHSVITHDRVNNHTITIMMGLQYPTWQGTKSFLEGIIPPRWILN